MKKFMLRVMPVVLVAALVLTNWVNAAGISSVTNFAQKIADTVITVVQILAVAAVVVAGVRYMFAGADKKSEIKDSMIVLVVGGILVFAAGAVIRLITQVGNEL
ncbi:MAG: TrbC/VirB2 family protein [Clostridia bacterium]|jgi:type IV secretory pathway VirB2 component (pilin)|nr:TrbC/VirB2 family protein [Clostridia bacterium]